MSRFICEVCDFSAPTRSRYYKHLSTQKHIHNASNSTRPVGGSFEAPCNNSASDTLSNLHNESSSGEIDARNNDGPSSYTVDNHEDSLQNIVVESPVSNNDADGADDADDADDEFDSDSDSDSDGYSHNDVKPYEVYFTLHELLEKNINKYNLYLDYLTSVHQNMLIIFPVLTAIFGFYVGRHW